MVTKSKTKETGEVDNQVNSIFVMSLDVDEISFNWNYEKIKDPVFFDAVVGRPTNLNGNN